MISTLFEIKEYYIMIFYSIYSITQAINNKIKIYIEFTTNLKTVNCLNIKIIITINLFTHLCTD